MPPFDRFSLKVCQEVMKTRFDDKAEIAVKFYNGDHWQAGDGWVGPQYDPDHEHFADTMAVIESKFVSQNVIGEITDRHVTGVLGREFHWKLTVKRQIRPVTEVDPDTNEPITKPGEPTSQEQALTKEAESLVLEWWNKRNILEVLKHALAGTLNVKRGPLRFSIPPGLRDAQGNLPKVDTTGAADMIYLSHMGFDEDTLELIVPSTTVYTDKNTRKEIGIFTYTTVPDVVEMFNPINKKNTARNPKEYAEVTYVDEAGFTILKIMDAKGTVGEPARLQLGGRLLMYEMQKKALISPQIVSQQKAYNMNKTMKQRNDVQAGFLERIFFNAKWPGEDQVQSDGSTKFVPDKMYTGGGSTTSMQGETFTDEQGLTHILTPSVTFRDPVPSKNFIESGDDTYRGILKESNQLHYDTAGDGTLSGESRKQSRDAYTKDLRGSANMVEGAVRWVIETFLALAADLSGKAGRYDSLRVYAEAKIDAGPVSAEDINTARTNWEKGFIDHESALSDAGKDDVDAIKERLATENLEKRKREIAQQEQEQARQTALAAAKAGGNGIPNQNGAASGVNGAGA